MGDLVGSRALNINSDPSLVLQQALINREKQYSGISNPQQQLAARLGGMLGGGLTNLANDRGFFDVSDPLLNKVTKIQGVYNQVASQIDPAANPEQFYTALQKAYSQDPELGQQALMAAQEAQKAKTSGMEMQIKESQLYKERPELIAGKIEDALKSGNEAEAMRLAEVKTRLDQNRELDIEAKQASIAKDKAYIGYQNALSQQGKYKVEPIDKDRPELGWLRIDLTSKNPSQTAERIPFPAALAEEIKANRANKPGAEQKGDKKPLSTFQTNPQMPPTDGQPRARGVMEQRELDVLAERKRQQLEADRPRQEALQQGREQITSLNNAATARGLIPMGQASYFDPELTFLDPKTNRIYRASEL